MWAEWAIPWQSLNTNVQTDPNLLRMPEPRFWKMCTMCIQVTEFMCIVSQHLWYTSRKIRLNAFTCK